MSQSIPWINMIMTAIVSIPNARNGSEPQEGHLLNSSGISLNPYQPGSS
jgi:hypothetical protein